MKTLFFSISVLLVCTFFTDQSFSQCGQTTITQSNSQTIISNNGIACNQVIPNIEVRENSFYRAFDLSSFGLQNDFEICQVQVGIQRAEAGSGGQQPATLNLYTSSEPFPQGFPGSLNLIGTTGVIQILDQQTSIVTIPVTGTAPPDSELVVELFIPDGSGTGNIFFLGYNSLGETGPSYLRAPLCGAPNPIPVSPFAGSTVNYVMNVTGNEQDPRTIALAPETATNPISNEHTVTATVDNDGVPEQGVLVTFEVMSGPNEGEMSDPGSGECTPNDDCTTDENGEVSWTYSSRNFGTDTISASFTNLSGGIVLSNFAQKTWEALPIPTLSQWGIISMAGILGLIGFIALRKRKAAA